MPLIQLIPIFPKSKFFPISGKNIKYPQDTDQIGYSLSANISTANSAENSLGNYINISDQKSVQSSVNLKIPKNNNISKELQWLDINLPTNPVIVLKDFKNSLSDYEKTEILNYPSIYCIGIDAKKKKNGINCGENFGFDDENGNYRCIIKDHIAFRYEIFEIIGQGSFGQVFRVFDYKNQCFCALKIIKNKVKFHRQAVIEIEILKFLREQDDKNSSNIVHIQSSFNFRSHIVSILFSVFALNY